LKGLGKSDSSEAESRQIVAGESGKTPFLFFEVDSSAIFISRLLYSLVIKAPQKF